MSKTTKSKTTAAEQAAKDAPAAKDLTPEQMSELTAPPEGAAPSGGLKPSKERHGHEAHGPKVESVRVLIKMNELTTVPRRVFVHEIAILQLIHGEENIEVVDGSEIELALIGDAQAELDRLMRVYGRKGGKAVLETYHSARDLADALGIEAPRVQRATKKGLSQQKQSSQRGAGVK